MFEFVIKHDSDDARNIRPFDLQEWQQRMSSAERIFKPSEHARTASSTFEPRDPDDAQGPGDFMPRFDSEPAAGQTPAAMENLMSQARNEADQILLEARREAEAIEKKAYENGYAQGEKAGAEMGEKKFEPVRKALEQLIEELSNLREQAIESNDRFILQMGFMAASEILHHEIKHNEEEAVKSNVRAALEKVVRGSQLTLRVAPHDYKLLQAHLPDLLTHVAKREDFVIEPDAEIARGGCFLSTEGGDIDAQIDNQLALLRQQLLSEED